ncbi:MAG: hypothetical protein ACI4TX_02660 [Christensenellales bacterium]
MVKFKKIMLYIFYVVLCLMLAFNLYNVLNKVCGNLLPNYFGISYVCMGNSTEMNISGGELLVVKRVSPDSVKEGELLVFKFNNQVAVSKVKHVLDGGSDEFGGSLENGGYVTMNDVSDAPNAAVSYNEVYGKVIASYANLGNLLNYFTSWEFNLLMTTVFIVVIWTNILLLNIKIKVDEEKEERMRRYKRMINQHKG